MTTFAQLHLDYAEDIQEVTLYLDQQVQWHIQLFKDELERISVENKRPDHQVNVQLRCMKEALHYLETIKIHAPDFNCDIDAGSDGPAVMQGQHC